jgi:hypothetical protein
MRVSAIVLLSAMTLAPAAHAAQLPPPEAPNPKCPRTSAHVADSGGIYRGAPVVPRKLNQLPPATTYMAVYRHIGQCEAPLTMVEYRNPRRR